MNVVSVSLADVETLGLAVRDQELAPEADLPDERAADLVVTLKSGEVYKNSIYQRNSGPALEKGVASVTTGAKNRHQPSGFLMAG